MSKPAVVFGGPSPEHDISILTGLQAARALVNAGRDVDAIYWSKTGQWFLVSPSSEGGDFADGVPARARPLRFVAEPGGGFHLKKKPLDVSAVLNACHGGPGEDGTLQGLLDLAGLRYTGPDAAASALGMDKLAFGGLMVSAGLPSLPRILVDPEVVPDFAGPYIVKPRYGGSSIGIVVVEDHATAVALLGSSPHMREGGVLEPFLSGSRDLNIAVRTYPALETSAIEAPHRDGDAIYDYSQKYLVGEGGMDAARRQLPAELPDGTTRHIETMARSVARLARLRSVARIDFLAHDDTVYVNEVNTIPGSLAAYLWVEPVVARARLLGDMLDEVLAGPARQYTTAGADGTALRSAGTIASKLG
ncbi:MAG: hypothetical protein OEO77_13805 [Acidimicrobiia bacterium]|nr:hypothetical protein [Acidimicrobiia bacterium]